MGMFSADVPARTTTHGLPERLYGMVYVYWWSGHLESRQLRSSLGQRHRHHAGVDPIRSDQEGQGQGEVGDVSSHRPDLASRVAETARKRVCTGRGHEAGGRLEGGDAAVMGGHPDAATRVAAYPQR